MCMLACQPQHTCSRLARNPARRRSGQIDFIEFLDMFSQQLLELQQLEQFLHMDAAPSDWPKRDGKLVEVCLALLQASSCHFASWLWLMPLSDSSRHKGQHASWRSQAAPRHSYACRSWPTYIHADLRRTVAASAHHACPTAVSAAAAAYGQQVCSRQPVHSSLKPLPAQTMHSYSSPHSNPLKCSSIRISIFQCCMLRKQVS